jgi:hypothetical protein
MRQQSLPVAVDQHRVVVALPGVDPNPALLDSIHALLPECRSSWNPLDKLAVRSLGSDESQISISGQAVSRLGAANQLKPCSAEN